jgi:hypothetical protein
MVKKIRCQCAGDAECKLCRGTAFYEYEPGPLGWQLIPCPTCEGAKTFPDPTAPDGRRICLTCRGAGSVDPANPPTVGFWDTISKIFFGA